jgi:hypothetical protein
VEVEKDVGKLSNDEQGGKLENI